MHQTPYVCRGIVGKGRVFATAKSVAFSWAESRFRVVAVPVRVSSRRSSITPEFHVSTQLRRGLRGGFISDHIPPAKVYPFPHAVNVRLAVAFHWFQFMQLACGASPPSAVSQFVGRVFNRCAPSQICKVVVAAVTIAVATLLAIRPRPNESSQHKGMNRACSEFAIAGQKANLLIPVFVSGNDKPFPLAVFVAPNTPVIPYFVLREARNRSVFNFGRNSGILILHGGLLGPL